MGITGIRRCGKSSVLILLRQLLEHKGEKAAYLNVEDSRIKEVTVLDSALKWFGDDGYLLLDEVTSADDWDGWLARNHELLKGRLRLIVSSSRRVLAVPAKPLRGRMLVYELFPLSFKEFLQFKRVPLERTTAGIGRLEKGLAEYLLYGGFPEVVLMADVTDKVSLLEAYFNDIVALDVAEMAEQSVTTVELFGKYVLETPHFSASKCLNFFKSVGHKIGKQSLLELERHSQDGYLFFFVPIFSRTIKDRAQYPRKAFAGDAGFLYAMTGRKDMGRLFENAVFLELKRRLEPRQEKNYMKNRKLFETDFVIREGVNTKDIVQVAYAMASKDTRVREVRGLVACAKELGVRKGLVITNDYEKTETVDGIKVSYIPLLKWLLAW
ncbi:ATP-binding protein [Candidatus Woesearchaeota archaeon]|nr:ATP-binding protein [Candidatus Woesearchaeota archaeon]